MMFQLDLKATPFNLEHTLRCGQVFRWEKTGDWWYGVVSDEAIKIRQIGGALLFQSFPDRVSIEFLKSYFRLDDDLSKILGEINRDEHVGAAIKALNGLRIIRQDLWESLISYMCAAHVSIPAIKNVILNLSKGLGKEVSFDGRVFYTFPKPSDLAEARLEDLKRCGLGFRAERVLEASKKVNSGDFGLETLRGMSYEEARGELLSLSGVGHKVADCVLLFSLDKLEAFPVDVWMKRIILGFYPRFFTADFVERVLARRSITPREYEKISSFGRKYFGRYAGYAQEYLFHHKRSEKLYQG